MNPDRPYRHESPEALHAILADERIGEPAKRRVREELEIRRRELSDAPDVEERRQEGA